MDKRKVVHATLREGTHIPELGPISSTLSAGMIGNVKVLEMYLEGSLVVATFRNGNGPKIDVAFDTARFRHIQLERDPEPLPKPLKD